MTRMLAILVLTAAIAFAVSPLMVPGFNGFEPGQFPVPQEDPPAQPAGWAFSIWLLIYVWLIAGAGFGLLLRADDGRWAAHRGPLFASLAVGAAWLPVAQVSPVAATVLIWVMLGTALAALMQAGRSDRLWLQAPVAVYAGWLTAASCVALALVLAGHGVVSAQVAALGALVLALVLAAAVLAMRPGTPEYGLAVIWALLGVAVANAAPVNAPVLGLAVTGIAGLGVMSWRTA
ncbi:hypothetical protein [Roseovarius sp.]|uniref:hypothetical protein n=1 Tax=Roseovarius sp. TaxID=1486281 RepID=UPI003BAA12F3